MVSASPSSAAVESPVLIESQLTSRTEHIVRTHGSKCTVEHMRMMYKITLIHAGECIREHPFGDGLVYSLGLDGRSG